ncbi:MAG TPA: ABC transporter substrate-binding protein, partial [Acidimicrobiales bacterium]|nr:ABC transporter substrate-binding protein [Acidimicrobiales bacterium]
MKKLLGALAVLTLLCSALVAPRGAQAAPAAISVAEAPGASPNFIFPLDDCLHASTNNVQDFQQLMFRPLYWFGLGTSTAVQYPLSLASPPRVTDHGRTFSITLKGWRFTNGQVVDASSVKFFLNLFKSNPTDFCSYTPGYGIPDQLSAVGAAGNVVTLHFSSPESLNYVLDNYLSQITPMSTRWSRTATGPAPRCATGAYGAAATISACAPVLSYLNTLATNTKSFTGRFWQSGVDGPWTLTTFDANGNATFTSNPHYTGAPKPHVTTLKEIAYTSFAAELSDLAANKLTIGYLEPSVLTLAMSKGHGANFPSLASKYTLAQTTP